MYNLNINIAQTAANAASNLLVEGSGPTPRTPEILNSIVAMTNPLEIAFAEEPQKKVPTGPLTNVSSDSNSSSCSQIESPTTNPPSLHQTHSDLVKTSLKLSIEKKRKCQNDVSELLDLDNIKRIKRTESESEDDKIKQENGLTPEDEERRRRRRERNKIAATKCRLKKRERTANLVSESEILEAQHAELTRGVAQLEEQKRNLEKVLQNHRPHCRQRIGPATRDAVYRLPPVASVMDTHSYSRSPSNDPNFSISSVCYDYARIDPMGGMSTSQQTYSRSTLTYSKPPPSIIVEEINDYDNQFTNLDDYNYNTQCHNYSGNQSYNNTGLDNGCLA